MASSRRPPGGLANVRRRPAIRLAAASVAALAGLAVAGCGSASAGSGGSDPNVVGPAVGAPRSSSGGTGQDVSGTRLASGPALCAHPGRASRLLVTRTGGIRILEGGQRAQPAGSIPPAAGSRPVMIRRVTDRGEVTGLARALCALPRMPSLPLPCPALFPGSYQLYFTADGLRLPVVVVEESGCRTVTGLGPVRRADQPGFWRRLGHIIGGDPLSPGPPGSPVTPGSPGSVQPGGPDRPGSGLLTGCEPTIGQPPRACPYQSGLPRKPWA